MATLQGLAQLARCLIEQDPNLTGQTDLLPFLQLEFCGEAGRISATVKADGAPGMNKIGWMAVWLASSARTGLDRAVALHAAELEASRPPRSPRYALLPLAGEEGSSAHARLEAAADAQAMLERLQATPG